MKKILVEVKTLDEYICTKTNAIYLDGTLILTPSAKDELYKRGIAIVQGKKTETDLEQCAIDCVCEDCINLVATGDTEKIFYITAAILKKDFGVTDVKQLQEMSCRIAKTINKTMR